jgi:hypothetical protein
MRPACPPVSAQSHCVPFFACRIRSRSMRASHHSGAPGQLLADAVSVRRGHTTLGQVGYMQQPDRKGITIGRLSLSHSLTHSLKASTLCCHFPLLSLTQVHHREFGVHLCLQCEHPDARNVPSFRRWRFEMKLSPFFFSAVYFLRLDSRSAFPSVNRWHAKAPPAL